MTDRSDDDGLDPDLPALDLPTLDRPEEHAEDGEDAKGVVLGIDDPDAAMLGLSEAPDDGVDDPFDDANADDLPLEIDIHTDNEEPSAVGDHHEGFADAEASQQLVADELHLTSAEHGSFVDDGGRAAEGLDEHGDDELGIDPIPREIDDGGLEGLEDPTESEIASEFPPLDGHEEDDEEGELELGIELEVRNGDGEDAG